jgi:hypothetical protein
MKSVGNSYVHPLSGADEVGESFLCTHLLSGADEVGWVILMCTHLWELMKLVGTPWQLITTTNSWWRRWSGWFWDFVNHFHKVMTLHSLLCLPSECWGKHLGFYYYYSFARKHKGIADFLKSFCKCFWFFVWGWRILFEVNFTLQWMCLAQMIQKLIFSQMNVRSILQDHKMWPSCDV